MKKKDKSVQFVNTRITKEDFIWYHKRNPADFTRDRVLNFSMLFILILKKSIKSLQLMLNELFMQDKISATVSASAYTQARKKFKHSAFVELNEGIVRIYYEDDDIKRWNGYRLVGVDGSKIILPNTKEMQEAFGRIKIKNAHTEADYTCGLFTCCYDVLNHIAIKSSLTAGTDYEVSAASQLLESTEQKEILIYDRGYASYDFLATLEKHKKDYVIRCSKSSFKATQALFSGQEAWSKIVQLKAPADKLRRLKEQGLPTEISVRLVSVILSTGEIEVLVTSLKELTISREEFQKLYFFRWGVEGFFHQLKGRLCLENFTGKTVESVKQDFWSTLFMSNLETIFTEETEEEINVHLKEAVLPKKVNKAVSFNALKNMVFDIFFNEREKNTVNEKLTKLFKTNVIVLRKNRHAPREKASLNRSYNYQRRQKKHVY